jgi:glycine hydroxymethyltransferase
LKTDEKSGAFIFKQQDIEAKQSSLYNEHIKLIDKSRLAPFAGFLMPLWYSSVSDEHNAVRTKAGLFDCSHMGVLEVTGPQAFGFLNTIFTNDLSKVDIGGAQYGYVLDAAGNCLDDIIIYRRAAEKFMVVVNAANEPKIKAYVNALLKDRVIIDAENPKKKLEFKPSIRDMRDTGTGSDSRIDLALQGPASLDIILALVKDKLVKDKIRELKPFKFVETNIDGIDCIISRTGYTGTAVGFEIYVHPAKAPHIWSAILKAGSKFGILPCGLGARDSLRIEAGFPLYGHELAGPYNVSPFEAGYGFAVKLQKEFFIGKAAMQSNSRQYNKEIVRLELPGEKGIRPVRQNDAVLSGTGECIGWILSCAGIADKQIALALITKNFLKSTYAVGIYYLARNDAQVKKGKKNKVEKDELLQPDITGLTLSRFAKF